MATTVDRLARFADAAAALSDDWDEALDEGYPFDISFDEVVARVMEWHHTVVNAPRS